MTATAHKLDELASLCKGTVHVTYNEHRVSSESIEAYLRYRTDSSGGIWEDERPDDLEDMVAADKLIELQFYPRTNIGSYSIAGCDLDRLLDQALKIVREDGA